MATGYFKWHPVQKQLRWHRRLRGLQQWPLAYPEFLRLDAPDQHRSGSNDREAFTWGMPMSTQLELGTGGKRKIGQKRAARF